jgi:LysR family nitrogen assimilation transcriptional regulator
MIDVRKLKHFLAIVEAGSLTRAAEILRVAQPALTHSLRALEDELGVELFERHARGVKLTEFGKVLEEQGRLILREVDRTRALIKHRNENPGGSVALAIAPLLVGRPASALSMALRGRLPDTRISVHLQESPAAKEQILDGEIDLALTYASINDQAIVLRPLVVEQLVVLAPRSFAHSSHSLAIKDLEGMPLVLPPQRDPIRLIIDEAANRNGVKLQVALEIASPGDAVEHVRCDGLSTILPERFAQSLQGDEGITTYPIVSPRIMCCLFLMKARNRLLSRATNMAYDVILAAVEELVTKDRWLGRFVGDVPSTAETITIFSNPK